ncbi:helix-turn-helix transcriptional regulator [Streptomyces sp. NPDC002144]
MSQHAELDREASRNALLELVKELVLDQFDDRELTFIPALAQAAKDLVDTRLTDADLSPTTIAAHLHVSVRTLQRAFASLGESLSAYIRRPHLEEAATALTTPESRLTVSEPAALWHFTDSSRFIRAFRKQYGATPARFARRPPDDPGVVQAAIMTAVDVRSSAGVRPRRSGAPACCASFGERRGRK